MEGLSRKELEKLKRQMKFKAQPRETWEGRRPTVFVPKNRRRAADRQEAKRFCRDFC